MERIEYQNILDHSEWPEGPWDGEPDKVQWQDEATGLPCLIVRNLMGALCGYVGVPEGHPAFGKDYSDEEVARLDVHGGITFGAPCQEDEKGDGICHIPGPGEPDNVWWLGFDCAHLYDRMPRCDLFMNEEGMLPRRTYRDMAYVTAECSALAVQLKGMR